MEYKALMSDVDGTLIPYDYDALPSQRVVHAVSQAEELVHINLVTGRSYAFIKQILSTLNLKRGFAVINNGAQVFDIATDEILYDQPIDPSDVNEIITILDQEHIPFYIKQDGLSIAYKDGPFTKGTPLRKGYMFFTDEILPEEKADELFDKLAHLSNLTKHKSHHKYPDKYGINITHGKATKMHGIQVVMERLSLQKHEVIGVGDSYNDFPLLMACGLKIAMGNAIEDLKAIADYVAPSVTQDGVAHVIEKFILRSPLNSKL